MKRTIIFCLVTLTIVLSAVVVNAAQWDNEKNLQRDLNLTEPMYEILGMLGEYISRFSYYDGEPHPNLIEIFYPNEIDLVEPFENLLVAHADITGLKKDWKKEKGKQGHIMFYSSLWSNIINSYYIKVEKQIATLNTAIFDNASQNEMLRFLQGANERFGAKDKSSSIEMTNAPYKVETIANVLKKLGCKDIVIFVLPALPHGYQVHFNPSPVVKKVLSIKRIVLEPSVKYANADWRLFKKIN
jgi:hypothetical protein